MLNPLNRYRSSLDRISISRRDDPDEPIPPLVDLKLLTVLEVNGNHSFRWESTCRVH
jgi:hypothetical protein